MRIVYMGTPQFAATILEFLANQHDVVAVYTRPDAIRGRGNKLSISPVKEVAQSLAIPVIETKSFKNPQLIADLEALNPDCICVAAFGVILPEAVLAIPRYGCLNVHASLLPRWRGAAPIARAILAGDEETGVCIMKMEEGLDTGDYCIWRSTEIGDMTTQELSLELADLGATALLTALEHIEEGFVEWMPQPEEGVTYAHKIEKGELNINPSMPASVAQRHVQASDENHPARAKVAQKPSAIVKTRLLSDDDELNDALNLDPGQVKFFQKRLWIGCNPGVLEIVEIQPDGKKPMTGQAFAAGIQGIKQQGSSWSSIDEA